MNLEKKIHKFRQCIFAISILSPLGKRRGPSFEQNWIPFTKGCFQYGSIKTEQFMICVFVSIKETFLLFQPLFFCKLQQCKSSLQKSLTKRDNAMLISYSYNYVNSIFMNSLYLFATKLHLNNDCLYFDGRNIADTA